jgi:hypothetical protein
MSSSLGDWFEAHKPAASRRSHMVLAALMWTFVGTFLAGRGGLYLVLNLRMAGFGWLILSCVLGLLKGAFALDKAAKRILARIDLRQGMHCIGGFLSVRSWALVALMIFMGRLLRLSHMPALLVSCLYVTVGTALVFSSRLFWRRWMAEEPTDPVGTTS